MIFFQNTFKPEPLKVQLDVFKSLVGRPLLAGEFEFVLKDETGKEIERVTNLANGQVVFSELSFPSAGTYRYNVEEVNNQLPGVTYQTGPKEITFQVAQNPVSGQLELSQQSPTGQVLFENIYVEPTTTTTTNTSTTTSSTAEVTAEPTTSTTTTSSTTTTAEPTTTTVTTTTAEPTTTTVEPTTTVATTTTTVEPTTTVATTAAATTTTTAGTTVAPATTTTQTPPTPKKGKTLPKTGEESGLVTTLVGFALLAAAGLAGVFYRKSKKA